MRYFLYGLLAIAFLGLVVGLNVFHLNDNQVVAAEATEDYQAVLAQVSPTRDINNNIPHTIAYQTYPSFGNIFYATVTISNYDTKDHLYNWSLTGDATYTGQLIVFAGMTNSVSMPFNPSTISATVSQPEGRANYKFCLSFTGK